MRNAILFQFVQCELLKSAFLTKQPGNSDVAGLGTLFREKNGTYKILRLLSDLLNHNVYFK